MTSSKQRAGMSRRKFMEMMGVTAGGVAGLNMLPPAIQQALAIEPNNATGTIRDVEHVVIMMQENRSFNHYFGTYNGVRGFTDPRPVVSPKTGKDLFHQPINDSVLDYVGTNFFDAFDTSKYGYRCGVPNGAKEVLPFPMNYDTTGENQRGTNHGVDSGQACWNDGRYDNWIPAKKDVLTMAYLKHKDISYHRYLANAFTVCDHYFVSCHGDTIPNRQYLVSGAAANPAKKNPQVIWPDFGSTPSMATRLVADWTTYPERIEKFNSAQTDPSKKISWRTYQGGTGIAGDATDCYEENNLAYFAAYDNQPVNGCYWVDGACYKDGKAYTGSVATLPDLVRNGVTNRTLKELKQDVLDDKLPNISWIVAPYIYCEHPQANVTDGAYYINEVLSALVSNPDVWSKTVFILNYDENDGLFDHVVPPMPTDDKGPGKMSPSLKDGLDRELYNQPDGTTFKDQWIGLGPRVPAIVVSPWSKGGWVCSEVFDHTSTLRFLEARFGLESDQIGKDNPLYESNITPWRRGVTGDMTSAFDFSNQTAAFPQSSKAVTKSSRKWWTSPTVPSNNALPMAENPVTTFSAANTSNPDFTRQARPLPHEFHVNGQYDAKANQFVVDIVNSGAAGAYFYVYDYVLKDEKPRRYSVVKDEPLQDSWAIGDKGYNLAVHGANGFYRLFKGVAMHVDKLHPEVEIMYQSNGGVTLKMINRGIENCQLKITSHYDKIDNADGLPTIVVHTLKGAACTFEFQELATKSGWYDISVELLDDKGNPDGVYLRRFAGHVETGLASITDPFLTYNKVEAV